MNKVNFVVRLLNTVGNAKPGLLKPDWFAFPSAEDLHSVYTMKQT